MTATVLTQHEFEDTFRIRKCLGKGAFASVYSATHRETDKHYAMKQLSLNDPNCIGEYEIGVTFKHPNIIKTFAR